MERLTKRTTLIGALSVRVHIEDPRDRGDEKKRNYKRRRQPGSFLHKSTDDAERYPRN